MAVNWLDLVRYADSVGFHSDVPINVYPYRDYVIRAFNQDKPFDQFTREQLAGDLLPNPTDGQLVATAFNRLNRMTNEGGAQAKEYLVKYAADRVRTVSITWLGSTMGCSECHDHKFDPFLQKEFYQMGAFFSDIEEEGVYSSQANWGPSIRVLPDAAKQQESGIERELTTLRKSGEGKLEASQQRLAGFARVLARADGGLAAASSGACLGRLLGSGHLRLQRPRASRGERIRSLRPRSRGEKKPGQAEYKVEIPAVDGKITAVRLEALLRRQVRAISAQQVRSRVDREGQTARSRSKSAPPCRTAKSPRRCCATRSTTTITPCGAATFARTSSVRRCSFSTSRSRCATGERLLVTMTFDGPSGRTMLGRFRFRRPAARFPRSRPWVRCGRRFSQPAPGPAATQRRVAKPSSRPPPATRTGRKSAASSGAKRRCSTSPTNA